MFDNEEVEHMDTSEAPWSWYYLADCGRWHRFEDDPDNPISSGNIEDYYLRDAKSVLNVSSSSRHSKIDFCGMLQTDLATGRQRRIQRSYNVERNCSCFAAAPVFWERVDPTLPYQLIPLSDVSPEYHTVANYVKHDGLLNKSIISISRIQNLDLWHIYCMKKKQLMRIQHVKEIQERRLFHGTNRENTDSICKFNFDLRLAGQNGHAFGKGIYFATHATYADKYSSSLAPLPKILFLARVMVGKSNTGEDHFHKPDHGSLENSHDSCVDDTSHPKIFVIFDPNQIYPEYLVQYK